MNTHGIGIMPFITKEQRERLKFQMHQPAGFLNRSFCMQNRPSSCIAKLSRPVKQEDRIPVEPDDNFKEEGEESNKVQEQGIIVALYNHEPLQIYYACPPVLANRSADELNFASTGGIPCSVTEYLNYVWDQVGGHPDQLFNHKEGEGSIKVQEQDRKVALYSHKTFQMYDAFHHLRAMRLAPELRSAMTVIMDGGIPSSAIGYTTCVRDQVGGRSDQFSTHKDEGERFNKLSVKDKQRYISQVFKPDDEVGDGRVFYMGGTSGWSTGNMNNERGETSGSSTGNMNYGRSEVRGHPDQNHIRKNYFVFNDEGKYEGLTEATQKSTIAMQKSFEAAMKQNIDNKKVNDEHVVDMPKGPDHNNKKEQANDGDGLFRLCEIGLANTVSLMGSNPPPWATTPASQRLLGFSGAANAVGYVGTTAALSLRNTKPGVARIFANVGSIGCAWGVIMGYTSYLPGEFQWVGYVAAMFCTLMVLLANF